jgi:hypothetical protein
MATTEIEVDRPDVYLANSEEVYKEAMADVRGLLGEIVHCSVANEIRFGTSISCPCHKIVRLQTSASFQLPEPWSGQIDVAPILFISSSPSIDELELYPDQSWDSDRTADFFYNRFNSSAGW